MEITYLKSADMLLIRYYTIQKLNGLSNEKASMRDFRFLGRRVGFQRSDVTMLKQSYQSGKSDMRG